MSTASMSVNLATTGFAVFRNSANTANITSVVIPAGASSVSFRYRPSTSGNKTITVSNSGFTSASQVVAVP